MRIHGRAQWLLALTARAHSARHSRLLAMQAPLNTHSAGSLRDRPLAAFAGGAAIGLVGGLIGLGGAEFRLP